MGFTYDGESADDLARRVDVAGCELGDEVGGHADDGYDGDEAKAAGDEEGFG